MKKYLGLFMVIVIGFMFNACANNTPQANKIVKVYETTYPEGISVFISNNKIKENLTISDARVTYGKNKRQLQCIISNNSDNTYNLIVDSKWTDDRGVQIAAYPNAKKIKLNPGEAQRIVIDAPNYKAKDVLLKIGCSNNCIQKD